MTPLSNIPASHEVIDVFGGSADFKRLISLQKHRNTEARKVGMSLFNTLQFILKHPLNRKHPIDALMRFAKWQLTSRLAFHEVVYEWVDGAKFFAKAGETGITGNIYAGLHEFDDMAFLLHVLRAEDLFIDVGANVGSYTLLACAAIGARGCAFEPAPGTYQRLVDNVRLNHMEDRVRCFQKAVGEKPGTVAFTSTRDAINHALAEGEVAEDSVVVEVTTLDDALQGWSPCVMKIDVEGYETLVLKGASETLKNPSLHSVIMELNGSGSHYGFDESWIVDCMFEHGFRSFAYEPMTRTLRDLQRKNPESGNTLFIRNESFVRERLQTAPKISVHGTQF